MSTQSQEESKLRTVESNISEDYVQLKIQFGELQKKYKALQERYAGLALAFDEQMKQAQETIKRLQDKFTELTKE